MRFQRDTEADLVEPNLIPLIDVLLVVLIFLVATTTFQTLRSVDVTLPQAGTTEALPAVTLAVSVHADGQFSLPVPALNTHDPAALRLALIEAQRSTPQAMVVIQADAQAPHQAVLHVMQAAADAGFAKVGLAVQESP